MIPEWLIIAVGIAAILCLSGPFIVALLAGLVWLVAGLLEEFLTRSGFYRWRHRRRLKTGYYRKRMQRGRRR